MKNKKHTFELEYRLIENGIIITEYDEEKWEYITYSTPEDLPALLGGIMKEEIKHVDQNIMSDKLKIVVTITEKK